MTTMTSALLLGLLLAQTSAPPDLLEGPARPQNPGTNDVALVIGIEDYAYVTDVPYAERDARAFANWLVRDRGVPSERVRLLLNEKGSKENIEEGIEFLARNAHPEGHLWVYFAGHGMPSVEGGDGLLAGPEVQQSLKAIAARSVSRQWLVQSLERIPSGPRMVILDACFSGRSRDGNEMLSGGERPLLPVVPLVPNSKVLVFSAAGADEVSGPWERVRHGLFTYFVVGGLKGWADLDADRQVTARELAVYVRRGANTVLADGSRSQNPVLNADAGDPRLGWALAAGTQDSGPDLNALSPVLNRERIDATPTVKLDEVPALSGKLKQGGAVDLNVDADALILYDAALKADPTGNEQPDAAAAAWQKLADYDRPHPYREEAMGRARQWREFSEKKRALAIQREADDERLKRILPLRSLSAAHKEQLVASYASIYGGDTAPRVIEYVQPEEVRSELCRKFAHGHGKELEVVMPTVFGTPLTGTVLLDGNPIGTAPGKVRIARCASQLEVREKGGKSWSTTVEYQLLNRMYEPIKPVFEEIIDDDDRAPPPTFRDEESQTYVLFELTPYQPQWFTPRLDYSRIGFRIGHQFVARDGVRATREHTPFLALGPLLAFGPNFGVTTLVDAGVTFLNEFTTVAHVGIGTELLPTIQWDYLEWNLAIVRVGLGLSFPSTEPYVPLSLETRVRFRTGYVLGRTFAFQAGVGWFGWIAGSRDSNLGSGMRFTFGPEF